MFVRRELCSSAAVRYGTTTDIREARSSVIRLRYCARLDLKEVWLVNAVSVSALHSLQCEISIFQILLAIMLNGNASLNSTYLEVA